MGVAVPRARCASPVCAPAVTATASTIELTSPRLRRSGNRICMVPFCTNSGRIAAALRVRAVSQLRKAVFGNVDDAMTMDVNERRRDNEAAGKAGQQQPPHLGKLDGDRGDE